MPHSTTSLPLFLLLSLLPFLSTSSPLHTHPQPIIPHPQQQQTLLPLPFPSSNTTTNTTTIIPSFPSQTSLSPCHHLPLPPLLLSSIHSSCIPTTHDKIIKKSRCCPTLAAWLYWAYSGTALNGHDGIGETTTTTMNMPMMPDDSETCVEAVEEGMREKGVVLGKVNGSCGLVYCYCGIRLHGLSCPGFVTGDQRVRRLERDCRGGRGRPPGGGCDTCLHSLYQLGKTRNGSTEKIEDKRTSKMRGKECELMGITWLLAKNRTAYVDTVTSVLRAIMMSPDGSYPRSCSLKGNEFPLAVDSAEISSSSSASTHRRLIRHLWFSFCSLYFAF